MAKNKLEEELRKKQKSLLSGSVPTKETAVNKNLLALSIAAEHDAAENVKAKQQAEKNKAAQQAKAIAEAHDAAEITRKSKAEIAKNIAAEHDYNEDVKAAQKRRTAQIAQDIANTHDFTENTKGTAFGNVSPAANAGITGLQEIWRKAKAMGDEEKAAKAHQAAEAMRVLFGFSGGKDGSQMIKAQNPTGLTEDVRTRLVKQGYEAMQEAQKPTVVHYRPDSGVLRLPDAEGKDEPTAFERVFKTLTGGLKGSGAGFVNAAGTAAAAQEKNWKAFTQSDADLAAEELEGLRTNLEDPTLTAEEREWVEQEIAQREQRIKNAALTQRSREGTAQATYELADDIAQSGQADLEQAKQGTGALGQFLVDVGAAGVQLGTDLALGAVTGTGSLPLSLRAYGGAAQTARQEGASHEQQVLYGAASAAVEALTEKIGNVGVQNKVFGKGFGDDVARGVVQAIEDLGKTAAGKKALNRAASAGVGFLGEGLEEAIAEAVNPLLQRAIYSDKPIDLAETAKNAAYSFLVGGALGGVMGSVSGTETTKPQVLANTAAPQDSQTLGQNNASAHTPEMKKIMAEYDAAVDETLKTFAEDVLNKKQDVPKWFEMKKVTDREADDIKTAIGVDASGFKTKIEKRAIEHIWKDHGAEGTSDTSMADVADFARIQYVIDNYDSVEDGGRANSYKEPNPNMPGKNRSARTVVYKKQIDGHAYVVRAVPDTSSKTSYIVSAYRQKNRAPQILNAPNGAPGVTSKNASEEALVNNIIARDTEIINNLQKNGENSSEMLRQGVWGENEVRPQVKTEEDVRPETPDYEAEDVRQNIAELQFDAIEDRLEAEARAEEIERMGREQLEALESRSYEIPDEQYQQERDEILQQMAEGQLEALESSAFDVDQTGMTADEAPLGPSDEELNPPLPAEPTAIDIAHQYNRDVPAAQRALEEAEQHVMLSERDERTVQSAIMNGGNVDWQLCDDPPGAIHIYEMRRAVEEARRPWLDYISERQQTRAEFAAENAELFDHATDKVGISFMRETMERNMYDIFGKSTEGRARAEQMIDNYFAPVHKAVADGNRLKNEMRGRIKELGLNKAESAYTQMIGEGKNDMALKFLSEHEGQIDQQKCREAAKVFQQIYNQLHDQMNAALIDNGYEPARYRRNYFPHFREKVANTTLGRIAQALGFYTPGLETLPTDIAGITDEFRPGKKWFGNLMQRKTDVTSYDAVKGFDNYIETAADVIYLTDSIRNLNALEDAIRYRFSDAGTQEQIDRIRNDRTIDALERMRRIEEIYDEKETGHGALVTELRRYSNHLAGKKDRMDRGWEEMFGRDVYSFAREINGRFAANMVGGNLGSALTNFIPITQATAEIRPDYLLRGMLDTVRAYAVDDGFVNTSDFLTNRHGSDRIDKTGMRRVSDVIGSPMQIVDHFTSSAVVRSAYAQYMAQGEHPDLAMAKADALAARLMADRSKGAVPSLFRAQNPALRMLTAFQLEVNNQLSYMGKDLPRELGEEGKARLAGAITSIFVTGWLYNQVYHALTGRDAAFEPITLIGEIFGILGDDDEEKDAFDKTMEIGGVSLEWMAENTPILGSFFGGGRVPISSALPDFASVGNALQAVQSGNYKRAAQEAYAGVAKPLYYLLPPVGGGALKKAVEGANIIVQGGLYGYNAEDERQLKFAHDSSDPWRNVQAILFGQYATPQAEAYVDSGFKSFSVDQTKVFDALRELGVETDEAYALAPAVAKYNEDAFVAYKGLVKSGTSAADAAQIVGEYADLKKDRANRNSPDEGAAAGSSATGQMQNRFREKLLSDSRLTVEQKKQLDMAILRQDGVYPDYSDEDALYLSTCFSSESDKDEAEAAQVLRNEYGLPVRQYVQYLGLEKNIKAENNTQKYRQLSGILDGDPTIDDDQRDALYRALIISNTESWAKGYAELSEDLGAADYTNLALTLDEYKAAFKKEASEKLNRSAALADPAFAVLFRDAAAAETDKDAPTPDQLADTEFSKWLDEQSYSDEVRDKIEDVFAVKAIPYRWDMLTNEDEVKYASALESSGIAITDYLSCKSFNGSAKADKDSSGKTISGSKKNKVLDYVRGKCADETQVAAVMRALGYSYVASSGSSKVTKPKSPPKLKKPKSLKSLF